MRDWLATAAIDPDRNVRLGVLPPPQMTGQIAAGALEGFCAGEPWGTLAEHRGVGRVVAATNDVWPGHPEKVLAVNRRWLAKGAEPAVALVRALLRANAFCHEPGNAGRLADVLSRPGYLDVPADVLLRNLTRGGGKDRPTAPNLDPALTFPSGTHALWLLREMARWGHVPAETDLLSVAGESIEPGVYRRAAEALGVACPPVDFPPMPLRDGTLLDPLRPQPPSPTNQPAPLSPQQQQQPPQRRPQAQLQQA
jgi:hypothetical protein